MLKIETKNWLIYSNYRSEHAHMLMINLSYDKITSQRQILPAIVTSWRCFHLFLSKISLGVW